MIFMNNRLPMQSSLNGLVRKKSAGNADITTILNLLPFPVFLLDQRKNQIIAVNNDPFFTAEAGDIVGSSPREIFPEYDFSEVENDGDYPASLIKPNKSRTPVILKIRNIDRQNKIIAVAIDWIQTKPEDPQLKIESMIRIVRKIIDLSDIALTDAGLSMLVNSLKDIFGTEVIGLYRADSSSPRLICVAQSQEQKLFPEVIPSSDLVRLSSTITWLPGKRLFSEIHKIGRIAGLSYIVSSPLGQNGRWSGLLVVGDFQNNPPREITTLVELTAEIISRMFDQSLLVYNLRNQIENQSEDIFVHSQLFDNLIEGILVVSPELLIRRINRTAEWMLGYADWEVKGKRLEDILISPDRLMHAYESARQGVAIPNSGPVSLHRRNGQSFPAQIKLFPVEKNRVISSILVFVEDISENEQIKAQAQHLEHRALLGEVTAVFAHEVRNPLNNLSTGLQLMSARLPEQDPNQELISRLQNDCNRMSHLMESVLIYARQSEYKFELIDLAQYTKRLLERWQPRFSHVSVNYYFQADEGNTIIKGDPRALEQVFNNLLTNAIDAMNKTGGTIAIKVSPVTNIPNYPQVEVTVSDNGPGIPDEIRERVFEPFLTTKPQGTGLGLAITKRIIVGHKGNITVDSFPGGTVFKIVIPAVNGDTQ